MFLQFLSSLSQLSNNRVSVRFEDGAYEVLGIWANVSGVGERTEIQ